MTKNAKIAAAILLLAAMAGLGTQAPAQQAATISITVKNHRFQPAEVHAPANVPIMLRIKNLDATAMEVESVSLRVEKVVTPNSEGIIQLRPLSPGRYNFFDDFHQETSGVLVVR